MFGLEILDVVIGLMFVYLLLALLATALNEYISAVLNLRGKELARGLGRLLDDLDEKDAVQRALQGLERKATTTADSFTEQFYNHRLIRPLATRRLFSKRLRLPSYIPARTFAMALLDTLGVRNQGAELPAADQAPPAVTDGSSTPPKPAAADQSARARLAGVLEILMRESPLDVTEHLNDVLANANLSADAQFRLVNGLAGTQTQLQKLHDSVEVWFNNSMDRVSGAYKRNVQAWLMAIGLAIATAMNADTIQMWGKLAANDKLADAMAERAALLLPIVAPDVDALREVSADTATPADTSVVTNPPTDTTAQAPATTVPGDSATLQLAASGNSATNTGEGATAAADSVRRDSIAWARFERTKAHLDSMELRLGWTVEEAVRIGVLRRDKAKHRTARTTPAASTGVAAAQALPAGTRAPGTARDTVPAKKNWVPAGYHLDYFPFDTREAWGKLLGLLFTALAISLGAPFWFDLLNRVISIRSTGRAPDEKPKSPEGTAKRIGEQETR